MNIKLKGSRLEAEIDKCRGECNWQRLSELLPTIRSKSSGLEHLASLIDGELLLENFLEQEKDACFPKESYYDFLRGAETLLQNAISTNKDENVILMEAYILISKLHFFCAKFYAALQDIEASRIDAAKTQFITLRSLKLAAECYAIKGCSLEATYQKQNKKGADIMKRVIVCFETSVELTISYVTELQKTINSKSSQLLETALERAPYLSLRKSVNERRWDVEGVECYRRIMTELSDKFMVEHVQQQLCRQLAEVLIRGMLDSDYDSRAINLKSKSLSFYTGSNTNYFAPKSRFEEVILLLLISEIIAAQAAKARRYQHHHHYHPPQLLQQVEQNSPHDAARVSAVGAHDAHMHNLKMVHNLLVFVLSNLRQYNLLSLVFERSMDLAEDDRHMWFQFALTLVCDNRFPQAVRTLEHCAELRPLVGRGADDNEMEKNGGVIGKDNSISSTHTNNNKCVGDRQRRCSDEGVDLNSSDDVDDENQRRMSVGYAADEDVIFERMLAARILIEQLGDSEKALKAASDAVARSKGTWLAGRCMTLYAFALSQKAEHEVRFEVRKSLMAESIQNFERAIELDPHDDLTHFFCALQYALTRNLVMAQERCQRALDLNVENPSALMLMALLYTAKRDYKDALELVINALVDFPTHYGLLVLRLKLESKYGRTQEVLQTSKNLLSFWQKVSTMGWMDYVSDGSTTTDDDRPLHKMSHNSHTMTNGASTLNSGGSGGGGESSASNTLRSSAKHSSTANINAGAAGVAPTQKLSRLPMTPIFASPLGVSTSSHVSLAASSLDITDNNSVIGHTATIATNLSEYGGTVSTISDSLGILSSSGKSYIQFPVFQIQANIWVELAEFMLEIDRVSDVQACVEEVCGIYPNSYQALYLKGRLFMTRAEESTDCAEEVLGRRLRAEARNCFFGALSLFPAHTPSLMYLSRVYAADENLKMAERMLRNVIAIDPLHFKCWHELGKILAQDGRIEEANECFQTAGALSFNTPLISFNAIPRLLKPCPNT